ncbi:MAG: ATP-dependent helicase, partial [Bacteroidetes bacterium CG_4_10_14_3_um_filter_31_20]
SKEIKDLAYSMVNNAVRIQISPKDTVSKTINHSVIFVEMDDKRFFAERIIKENAEKKFLIFVRTKIRAERVCKALERVGIISETMHSDKNQSQRDNVMKSFKNGKSKILIATDISARGIDIPDIDIVINYDLPEQAENYVHRVGRTGRADRKGTAISFCSSEEKELLNEIQGFINNEIKVIKMNNADYEQTIDLSENSEHDWQALIDEDENFKKKCKKK